MGTLYIIGNGFDLHFNLKTRTEHFVEYLREQSVYNKMCEKTTPLGVGFSHIIVMIKTGKFSCYNKS